MNNNTKSIRRLLSKSRRSIEVAIPHKIQGNRGSVYSTRTQLLDFGNQIRLVPKRPKVGGK